MRIEKVVLTGGSNSDPIHCMGARSVTITGSAAAELITYQPYEDGSLKGLPDQSTDRQLDAALGINSPTASVAGIIGRWDMPPWFGLDGNGTFYVMITWEQAGA